MTNILVHGLGQDETSWNEVKKQLNNNNGINVETPNLFSIVKNYQVNYENMYKTFADYCNSFNEKLNLVGLSLGGVLAIDYISEFPEKVNSIILIGTPYEIPKTIFTIQNIIYKFMPKRIFEKMGCPKKDMISLLDSMKNLSIPEKAPNIIGKVTLEMNDRTTEEFDDGMANARLIPEFTSFVRAINERDDRFCQSMLEKSIAVSMIQTEARLKAGIYFPADTVPS